MKRAIVSWSGGKDAAWALHRVRGEYEVVALLTTVAEETALVPIHNVSLTAIEAQAEALGLPLWIVRLPQPCSNAEYTRLLAPVWERAAADTVVFGDLFLADIREWRENLLATTRLTPVFPLWLEPTAQLAREMIRSGLRARVCAAPDPQLIGRYFDETFLAALPNSTDPCGENGEFHTFVRYMPGLRMRSPHMRSTRMRSPRMRSPRMRSPHMRSPHMRSPQRSSEWHASFRSFPAPPKCCTRWALSTNSSDAPTSVTTRRRYSTCRPAPNP